MSDTEQDKPVEEETSQAETQETEAEVEAKSNADESVDKPEDESADGATKANAEAVQDSSVDVVNSGIADGSSQAREPQYTLTESAIQDLPSIDAKSIENSNSSGPVDDNNNFLQSSFSTLPPGQKWNPQQATKSATKSSKKSKSKQSVKSKRLNSKSRSKVEGKSSGGSQPRSRSKVDDVSSAKIGFLGAGRMTESIVKGLLKADKVKAKQLYVAAKTSKNLDTFKVQGVVTTTRSYDLFGKFDCDIVFLNVHGFVVRNCFKLGGTRPCPITTNYIPTRERPIFILSLIGGVPLADVKTVLLNPEPGRKYQVEMHRVVLNTSVAYGLGLGVLDVELDSKKCNSLVRDTLKALGKIEFMEPDQMDAACSLIGNGMAYVYYFISALADGGFKMGLAKAKATKLATKAVQCAAQCLLETNKNPGELRDSVISPSGGAIYGIHVLEQRDCASGIHAAVEASYRRIKELVEVEK